MRIEKLPSGSYRARKTYNKKTYTIVLPYKPTEKELTIMFAEKFKNDGVKRNDGTFLHYATKYVESRINVVSPATVRTYNIKINQLSDYFKSLKLNDITGDDIQIEINRFAVEHAPKTTKSLHGFIASVLNYYRPGLVYKTKLPAAKPTEEYEPKSKEVKAILKAVKDTEYSIPFQLGVLGLRRGEICALTLDDLKGNELYINKTVVYSDSKWITKDTPKTETSNRTLYIPDSLVNEIKEKGYIFNGHPNALNKAIHRTQASLGIQEFKFHALRSYFASYAHTLGIPDKDIMTMGGWKTDEVMKRVYRKAMAESTQKSMKKLSNKILS